jgi:phosphohistidine phosphatase
VNLYFLRHAIAADKNAWKGSDSDRPLTKEGVRKMRKAAKGIRRLDFPVDWILTSPFRRAFDTAAITAKGLKLKKKLRVNKALAPDGDPKMLVRYLTANFRSWESLMLVGHEPYLGRLLGVLVGGPEGEPIELEKGALAKLSVDTLAYNKCATLHWLVTPKILRSLS